MLNATNVNERADKIALTPLRRLGEPIEVAYGLPVTRIVIACLPVENTGRRYGPGSGAGIGRPLPLPRPCERPPKAVNGCQEVRTRLAEFESGGRLRMSVEMLIGSGSA